MFRFLIIGNVSEVVHQAINKAGVSEMVTIEAFQPHDQVVQKMKKSHLLYLPIPETEGNEMIITGKIFEYLASKLPILSIGPKDGDADQILKQTKRSDIITYGDQEQLRNRLLAAWTVWSNDPAQILHNNDLHNIYERKTLTKKMAETLDHLYDKN